MAWRALTRTAMGAIVALSLAAWAPIALAAAASSDSVLMPCCQRAKRDCCCHKPGSSRHPSSNGCQRSCGAAVQAPAAAILVSGAPVIAAAACGPMLAPSKFVVFASAASRQTRDRSPPVQTS